MKVKNFLLLITCCCYYFSQAQINESDTLHFQLRGVLEGRYQTGNVAFLQIIGGLDCSIRQKGIVFKSENESLYQAFDGRRADNDLLSRNFLYFRPENRIHPFTLAFLSTNFRRNVEYRYTLGGGLSYHLIRVTNHSIRVSVGAFYEISRYDGTAFNRHEFDGDDKVNISRTSLYINGSHKFGNNQLTFYYQGFLEPALENFDNYRADLEAGLDTKVWKTLSLRTVYRYTYENLVVEGIRQNDTTLTFGLTYLFTSKT